MKLSIITATFNSALTVADCITSVNKQRYPNIEQIIIDGGSKDNTLEMIRRTPNRISRVISEPDKGIYDAMNKGIKLATGDIIGILNSDDIYNDKNVITRVVKEFDEKNVDCVFADLDFVDPGNLNKVIRKWRSSEFIRGSFAKGWHPAHPTFFVKKVIYKKYGMFDLDFQVSADFELMLRFIEKYQISNSYIPEVLIKMRTGGESTGSLRKILLGNKNIRKAFAKNGIKISKFYTPKRLVLKAIQRIKR